MARSSTETLALVAVVGVALLLISRRARAGQAAPVATSNDPGPPNDFPFVNMGTLGSGASAAAVLKASPNFGIIDPSSWDGNGPPSVGPYPWLS